MSKIENYLTVLTLQEQIKGLAKQVLYNGQWKRLLFSV